MTLGVKSQRDIDTNFRPWSPPSLREIVLTKAAIQRRLHHMRGRCRYDGKIGEGISIAILSLLIMLCKAMVVER